MLVAGLRGALSDYRDATASSGSGLLGRLFSEARFGYPLLALLYWGGAALAALLPVGLAALALWALWSWLRR
jgi:hypothetical protein